MKRGNSEERARKRKRRVVVELYRRSDSGRLVPNGSLVTEYEGVRRGGVVRTAPGVGTTATG